MGAGCINISKAFSGKTCKNGMGGVKNLWIGAREDIVSVEPAYPKPLTTASVVAKVDYIEAVPEAGVGVDSELSKFYKFPLPVDLGDYVEDASADPKLGTSFVSQTINGTLLGVDHSTSVELSKIVQGKQMLIAELYTEYDADQDLTVPTNTADMRPVYVLLGEENFMDLTSGGSRSGTESASLQGYELTWTGIEMHYARFLDKSKVAMKNDVSKGDYIEVGTVKIGA